MDETPDKHGGAHIGTDVRVVLVTVPVGDTGPEMARELVERGLVACVNIVHGLRSFYLWEGEIQDDQENLLVIKTTAGKIEALRKTIVGLHPYSVPEFLVLDVADGHLPYIEWVVSSCACGDDGS